MKSGSLDQWRNYFRSSNSDIFDIIDYAIVVAASDCPKEFKLRRDKIAERLFSCKLTRCLGCDKVELAVNGDDDHEGCKSDGVEFGAGGSKESKVNDHGLMMDGNLVSNYSFGEAEALTDEIEEESQFVGEVLRIRDILNNRDEESDSVLFESLRRLELMELSVDLLKATEIGKVVNPLRKHGSKEVRQLARTLIDGWKEMVDAWVKVTTTTAITGSEGGTPDSVNPSVVDDEELEEGLPSPPLDEGAFFVAPTGTIELSQFFDGMDDDGNPRQSVQFNKNRDNGRKPTSGNQVTDKRKLQASNETTLAGNDNKSQQMKKNEAAVRLYKPVAADSGLRRPPSSNDQRKTNMELKMQQKVENGTLTKRPLVTHQEKPKCSDDAAKLEATKRKLQERYQQAENAKRQRTIQVMELNDLPKQGGGLRNSHFKPGNHNRQWGQGRR
ncbi:probable mediator of RNA polymerase II transcription subunit 26b [Cicer arietinum]|uniref:Probable mediator of RNA polymerase II transcription subunit 26b n=1 Tax=Cicer arietinum TaxID=3827 RepID=A0A1S2XTH4_CICAR|nr:probable mediator of RNA polymerase II transcription subunit 26b [Cicer arietinum]XP_012569333.1 probable mediator of RNA polymerase II transcription subunit 26b [Cicer arietinum]XP_012569334.1 probable mediator of RNA polymerase II transcription subunit 26b [Cicer arietinum]